MTQVVDAFSLPRGRHALKAGVDFRWSGSTSCSLLRRPVSSVSRARAATCRARPAPASPWPASSWARSRTSRSTSRGEFRQRARVLELFVQDDWRATSRLTVNAGLRYTLNFPSTEVDDQSAIFDLGTQKLRIRGPDGNPRAARELHWDNLGPRIGLACSSARTVVRAGYALVWIEQAGITTPFTQPQFPFLQNVGQRSLDNIRPAFLLAQGPTVAPIELTPDAGLGPERLLGARDSGRATRSSGTSPSSASSARNLALEVAYAGSKGTHIGVPDTNINQLTVDQLALGNALLQRVPNPCFGQVPVVLPGRRDRPRAQVLRPYPCFNTVSLYRNNVGNTSYNALEVKLEKRFSRGLSFLVELHLVEAHRYRVVGLRRQHPRGAGGQLPGGRQLQPAARARRLDRRHPAQLRDELRVGPARGGRAAGSSRGGSRACS